MYDVNFKNVKKGYRFFMMFFLIGCLFLCLILWMVIGHMITISKLDSVTEAVEIDSNSHTDSDGDTMYSPIYSYKVRGRIYKCHSKTSSSRYSATGTVRFNSASPEVCMTSHDSKGVIIFALFGLIPIISITIAIVNFIKINKRVKAIKYLNQKGKLVKGLPYTLVKTGMEENRIPILAPQVTYTLPSGEVKTLMGDARFDRKISDEDRKVDLLIDEDNPDNYFIDFEINRLSGNLDTDYYRDEYVETVQDRVLGDSEII